MGTKIKEYGAGVSNIQHPVALGLGIGLYKLGQSLEDPQVQKKQDATVKFNE
ncbi:hypothetical protein [Poseidonibacter ostreae]|uniref:hypothetical protein n=1 Tax=Poseidonibacter ostreae TaxID=2654171 RepID=UPI00186B0602|nr:hypothetical protein [Poseidonibacter ostreae]